MDYDVIIIGSGFGGLCSAIKLREAGISNIVILEKDERFGGTWRVAVEASYEIVGAPGDGRRRPVRDDARRLGPTARREAA